MQPHVDRLLTSQYRTHSVTFETRTQSSTDSLGEPVYTWGTSTTADARVRFNGDGFELTVGGEVVQADVALLIDPSHESSIAAGDRVKVDGDKYRVLEVRPQYGRRDSPEYLRVAGEAYT